MTVRTEFPHEIIDLPDEGGYDPPEPPPIPRPQDAVGRFSWAALLGGPVVVIVANVLNWDRWLAGVGVALTIGGFVSLVARMKDREDDGSNGAVV